MRSLHACRRTDGHEATAPTCPFGSSPAAAGHGNTPFRNVPKQILSSQNMCRVPQLVRVGPPPSATTVPKMIITPTDQLCRAGIFAMQRRRWQRCCHVAESVVEDGYVAACKTVATCGKAVFRNARVVILKPGCGLLAWAAQLSAYRGREFQVGWLQAHKVTFAVLLCRSRLEDLRR